MLGYLLTILVPLVLCLRSNAKEAPFFRGNRDVFTNRPIIGVLSQDSSGFKNLGKHGKSYIASSYIKYLEAAGARVVPIRNDLTKSELTKLFYSINGVLFPGGGRDLLSSKYAKAGKVLFDLAVKANDAGDVFPLWGTCLGFELLFVLASKGQHTPEKCKAENYAIPLRFQPDSRKSRMFRYIPENILKDMRTRNMTLNMHKSCIRMTTFNKTKSLNTFFRVLTTNRDIDQDVDFVSTAEAYKYPFYGSQWHPEKNQFEWTHHEDIHHSYQAVRAAQALADFFVNQARMSRHHFKDPLEEGRSLIFEYRPRYCYEEITNFDECYFF
ncbi:gamma-glutamyl hydrolase [Nematostella vectensis]|uniref:gamma-glutamyl hydrolase n=1 Tax=Nematostella vectensis TaxID=45351 RepID=UPI0013904AEE|nr:gamma-glutamyl hydrolase [Nematostella vectensis]